MRKIVLAFLSVMVISILSAQDVTIYDIQYTTDPSGDSDYDGQTVTTSGIVTGVGYNEYNNNFFISMPEGGPWNGIYCYDTLGEPDIGDEVEITGQVQEYYNFTEIYQPSVTVLSTGNELPDPYPATTAEVASEEMYESVLVIISEVTVIELPNNFGEWFVDDGSGPCQIDDEFYQYPDIQLGDNFSSITGLIDYSYSEFGLNPRSADDFGTGDDTTPPTILGAQATSLTSVQINFSEALLQTLAQDEENYVIDGLEIFSASLNGDGSVVTLVTDEQTPGESYTITINDLEDLNGNEIEPNSTVDFNGYQELENDLFISEYIEGSSNNKALEIFNGTGTDVDLSGYRIAQSVNGGGWEYYHEWNSGTMLADGDVWVIATDEADQILQSAADEVLSYPSVVHYNGNDARGLEKDTGGNWTLIDVIGVPDEDPGDGWDVAGVTSATLNHTLVRKPGILQGNPDWASSAGTDAANSEWIVYDQDTFDYIGYHSVSGEDTTPPTILGAQATSLTGVQINFSEALLQSLAQDEENYIIAGLEVFSAALNGNGTEVNLVTEEQTPGFQYTITINNLEDLNGNEIAANSTVNFTGYQELENDLFISEYIEGSSNNKALEIYNGTGSEIDLGGYRIAQSVNGGGWEYYHEWNTGTMLANGDVWVIATDEADQILQSAADEVLSYPSVVHYNGNDARGLEKDTGGNWTLIDVIGVPDEDPGDGWDVAGVTSATLNHTLVRKPGILQGNPDWASSAGTDAANSEWIVYDQDTFDYIGFHSVSGEDTIPPLLINAVALSLTAVEISFNEAVEETSAENTANYAIDPMLDITDAELTSANRVTLTTSEQTPEMEYTITVNNVEDLAGNPIEPDSEIGFTGYVESDYTPISDIQENTAAYEGQTVTIHGIVTIGVNIIQSGLTNAYIQDDSGFGINIYDPVPIEELVRGAEVEITGVVEEYNGTTEITDPVVTVLSEGNPEPDPLVIALSETGNLLLEGTLLQVQGTIYEVYSAGGGTNLNIEDDENNEMTIRVWDTTGIDLSEFQVGYFLKAVGVGSEYNEQLQLVPGYQDQLGEGEPEGYEDVLIDPLEPEAGQAVTITFGTDIENAQNVILFWRTASDFEFEFIYMDSVATREVDYQCTVPGQSQGTTVEFFIVVEDENGDLHQFPENAPDETYSYSYEVTSHKAILNVPAHAFDPRAGQLFPLEFAGKPGNKAILRIFNSEGKLVFTAKNLIIQNSTGIYHFDWDGKDKNNKILPLGLYICHLEVIDPDGGKTKTANAPIVIAAPLK